MEGLIGRCGLDCSKCEAYIATKNDDEKARAKIAEQWSKMYGRECTADDCVCEGCTIDGLLSTAHANNCEIRLCAESRGVPTCAHCDDYICEALEEFLKYAPEAKESLERIKREINS
ncbi:hypothetical protein DRQ36_09125 [bacterium]|mgnify:CR=1 FL=1|nr:MAG: hypothetical protein DRQ36_09125 [bacterium]